MAIRIPRNAQHCPLPKEAERERIATACGIAMTAVFVAGCGGLTLYGFQVRRWGQGPHPTEEDQLTCTETYFRSSQIAPFSNRDTWAWEMCMPFATSIWVIPS